MGRFDEDDDEESTPARNNRSRDEESDPDEDAAKPVVTKSKIQRGWGAADKVAAASSSFAQNWRPTADAQLIKFLEDEPYASFQQHWVERTGQRSWMCLANDDPKGCPLCDAGDRAGGRFLFNIILVDQDGGDPVLRSYECGPQALDQLKNHHNAPQTGPLSKHYWNAILSGKKKSTSFSMVKERDLAEDWGKAEALTTAQLREFAKTAYTESTIRVPTRKDLLQIAAEEFGN